MYSLNYDFYGEVLKISLCNQKLGLQKKLKIMSSENKFKMPNSLNEHWMPFTSNKDFKENPRLIVEAKGVYLKNHQGKTQIDASSGLFCNPLGHGREEIIEAITKQLKTVDYAQPFQQGFGGSFELATKIPRIKLIIFFI